MAEAFTLPTAPIRINTRNEWLHGEDLINPKVADLFARSLEVDEAGEYAVRLGKERQVIEVDDTAFWVKSVIPNGHRPDALSAITLILSDGREETLDPTTLMQSADNVFYCRIERQGLSVPCRFAPHQYHLLALHAESEGQRSFLRIGGHKYPINAYDRRPRRA